MRSRKGFSLIELLAVILIMALVIVLIAFIVLVEINRARGSTLISEARMVYITAQTVVLESETASGRIEDSDYTEGLSGTVNDASLPVQTKLSQRMAALLAPDVVLSGEPTVDTGAVSFEVKDTKILSVSYQKMIGKRYFTVTIKDGETTITRN